MRILIAFASRYGSTRGIAAAIAGTLQAAGHVVDVRHAGDVADVAAYDTVVLGSAIYNTAWLPAAAEFVCRNRGALADRPVWLFSVGTFSSTQRWPFGVLARQEPKDIQQLRQNVHPRDYHVFAGAVERDRLPLVGRVFFKALKGRYGDYRDWQEIDAWAERIAGELAGGGLVLTGPVTARRRP
jgi:menaquinone-dependent protoporphyrinogen oxidase